MAGYEPKGKIEHPDETKRHACIHTVDNQHSCYCSLGVDHDLETWVNHLKSFHEADTAGDR